MENFSQQQYRLNIRHGLRIASNCNDGPGEGTTILRKKNVKHYVNTTPQLTAAEANLVNVDVEPTLLKITTF